MAKIIFHALSGRLGPYHAAVTRIGPQRCTVRHRHDFYEFFQVIDGSGTHCFNNQRIPLRCGHLVFIQPDDCHHFSTRADQTLALINIAFSRTWWNRFASLYDRTPLMHRFSQQATPYHLPMSLASDPSFTNMLVSMLQKTPDPAVLLMRASMRLVEVFEAMDAKPPSGNGCPPWLQELVLEMNHPDLMVHRIRFWQERSLRCPEHLARCCRKHYGVTLTELLNRARIERAKFRLGSGDVKLAGVAYEVGFHNLGYFYRVFRQTQGCTPGQWLTKLKCSTIPK